MDGYFSNVSNHTVTNTAFFPFKTGHLLKEQVTFSFSTYLEVSTSEVPAIPMKFVSKKVTLEAISITV